MLPEAAARPGKHLQHPIRQTRLARQPGDTQRGQGRIGRRFEDDRVAGSQGRCQLPRRRRQRKIPRHDCRDDAERQSLHQREAVGRRRRDFVIDLVDCLAAPADRAHGGWHIDARGVRDRFTDVERLEQCDLVAVVLDQLGPPHEHHLAIGRRHGCPGAAFECRARDTYCVLRIVDSAIRDVGQLPAVAGADRLACLAGQRVFVATVDKRSTLDFEAFCERLPVLSRPIQHRRVLRARAAIFDYRAMPCLPRLYAPAVERAMIGTARAEFTRPVRPLARACGKVCRSASRSASTVKSRAQRPRAGSGPTTTACCS